MRLLLAFILACLIHSPAHAEQKKHSERFEKFSQKLQLSEEQKPQVKAILKKTRTKLEAMREANHQERKALHEQTRGKLSKVLTADQLKQMDELHKKRREKRKEWRKEREQ